MFIIDLPLSSQLRKALEKAQKKSAEQANKRKEKTDAKRATEKRLQAKKREETGQSQPKCASCGNEGPTHDPVQKSALTTVEKIVSDVSQMASQDPPPSRQACREVLQTKF